MFHKLKDNKQRLFYASPLLFVAACALLVVIIGVFAVNNLQREKQLMTAALSQEGTAILNLVSATSRAMLRRMVLWGENNEEDWRTILQQAVENSSDHPSITALFLVDAQGVILAHSNRELIGQSVSAETIALLAATSSSDVPEVYRITEERDDDQVFQIGTLFLPIKNGSFMAQMREMRGLGHGRMGQMSGRSLSPELQQVVEQLNENPHYLVAELGLSGFYQAVRKQLIQVVFLSLVLLLVGGGGILSLMMLQGLRGSQMRLTRMQEFTELLVSSLPVGLIATGSDDLVRTCNESACRMLGIDAHRVLGKPVSEVIPKRLSALCTNKTDEPVDKRWELTLPEKDGTQKSLHITRLVLRGVSHLNTGVMVLIQDLSQVRELEGELERAERDAAIGKMAAGVAHEVRNPLSSIKGLALLLKERVNSDAIGNETADLLIGEVERLNRSIGELLDYGRPAQLNRVPVSLDELVARAVTLLRSDAMSAGIEIKEQYRCPDQLVYADQDKLVQVFLNLGINAIQAMSMGGILSVSTSVGSETVTITIEDTGAGIEPAIMNNVYDPYFTTKQNGTGLGLAMSKKIVDDHRGMLRLRSIQGQGTTAMVELPHC